MNIDMNRTLVKNIFAILSSLLVGWLSFVLAGFILFLAIMVLLGQFGFEIQYGDFIFYAILGSISFAALVISLLAYRKVMPWICRQPLALVLSTFLILFLLSVLLRPRFTEFIIY